jgi:hypothetical protein
MLCLILTSNLFAQEQELKNIIGFGVGYCPPKQAYIDAPPYIWVGFKASPVFDFFYERQVSDDMRLGGYFDYQNASFQDFNAKATRLNIGLNWLGEYPNTPIHAELGGYFGYGSLKADN